MFHKTKEGIIYSSQPFKDLFDPCIYRRLIICVTEPTRVKNRHTELYKAPNSLC